MVAVGGESPLDLQALLGTLESKSSSGETRLEAYNVLTKQLVDGEMSIFEHDIQQQGKLLLKMAKRDVVLSGDVLDQVAQKALHVMTYCLHEAEIVRFVAATELSVTINLLCQVATSTLERATCAGALSCLARQTIDHDIVAAELEQILTSLETVKAKWKTAVDPEILSVITRLCEQCEKPMETKCPLWGRLVLSQLASASPKVRDRAFDCAGKWTKVLSSSKEFIKAAAPDVKTCIVPDLKKLFQGGQEICTVSVWELLVKIFAVELVHGSFFNPLLAVVELAFCSQSMDTRTRAFCAWNVFIDMLSEIPNWLTDPKHLKLVMMVFTLRNTRTEASTLEKMKAWWHLVCCLGPRMWDNFDLVIKPLLDQCSGSIKSAANNPTLPGTPATPRMALEVGLKSPSTPRMHLASPGGAQPPQTFASVQLLGFEILAHLIGDASKSASFGQISFTLDSLKPEVTVSDTSFIKHSGILITMMFDLLKSQGTKITEPLLLYVWQSMISRLHSMLESSTRSERRETLSAFLGQFQVLVLSRVLPHKLILKLFQHVCSLPQKVLSSTAFSVTGQDVKGSPAQFLCGVLLTPNLLKECSTNESFMTVLSLLVQCGTATGHPAGVLEFCQSIVELMDHNAQFMPGPEVLWRLWSFMAHTLQYHVSQTNEVNQGDSLEYNFDCMHTTLLLPISHHLGATVRQPVCKTLMKTWSDLYRTFARLSALVTNTEANIAVETTSQRILKILQKENCLKDGAMLEYVMSICHVIVDTIDFSSLTPPQTFPLGLHPSPSKWTRRQHRPMGNLHSFICLVAMVMEGVVEGVKSEGEEPPVFARQKPSESASQLNVAANTSMDVVTVLVTRVNVSSIISLMLEKLAPPLAGLITAATKKTSVKLHTPASLQKLEKLWLDICTMIQSRYSGPYDSDFLSCLSPLLQATFLHPRRQIKNQTVLLWNVTFSRSAPLTYPSDLQFVVMKVKEKTPIILPGWVNVDVAVIEETPYSQMSQPDSMAPEPVIPGMPSPTRIRGSFLNRDALPSPKKAAASPSCRIVDPLEHRPFGGSARKKLSVDLMQEEDFVVITNTPKKKRILTEHQKEVLREKRVIPAMYNNLDASQDVSLMSQFSSSDTQQETLPTPPESADCVIIVNSSQSQDVHKQHVEMKSATTAPSGDQNKQMPAPTLRRSTRRKSVHFEETSNSAPASKECDTSSTEERPWRLHPTESTSSEAAESSTKETSSKSLSDDNVEKSGEEKKSFSFASPPPNLMAAIGDKLVETLSSKEASLSSGKTSSGSSGEEKVEEVADENDPFFRPFRSLSQSPPGTRSHPSEKSISENSVCMLTRTTCSQEIVGSVKSTSKEPAGKAGGERPLFTSLDKWLRKSPAVSDKPPVQTISESPEMIADSPPASRTTSMLVEETQSPKKTAEAQKTVNLSILETPPKEPGSVSLSGPPQTEIPKLINFVQKSNSSDAMTADVASLGLKEPVVQLERLSDADIAGKMVVSPPVPMETDAEAVQQNIAVNLDPAVLMDETASHAMSEEYDKIPVPSLVSPHNTADKNKISDNSEKSENQDHQNLLGFSELLEASAKDAVSANVQSTSEKGAASESMFTNTEEEMSENLFGNAEVCEGYNPGLTSTLLQTPPNGHIASDLFDQGSDSPSSESSVKNSQSSQSWTSSQAGARSDCEVSDFDPTKESTLTDVGDRAQKRKRRTSKKIEFPEKLRRTPRRKKERKSICTCCKDGPSSHHSKTHKETSGSQQENKEKEESLVAVREDSQNREKIASEKSVQDVGDMKSTGKTTDEFLESMATEKAKNEASKKDEEARLTPSPQDLGEKTPEVKTSSNITPLRKSTTKTKMEAARRRSISKSFTAFKKTGNSDSDSDDLPLSQLAQASCNMTKIAEKDSKTREAESSRHLPQSGQVVPTAHTRSTSKLRLKKLLRQSPVQALRSPPKLRLRQRKDGKAAGASPDKSDQIEVETPTKSPVGSKESRIEDVANGQAGQCPGTDLDLVCESIVTDFTPPSFRSGMSKSTSKKARKGLVKRLTSSPGRCHLRLTGIRLRTRSHSQHLSSPLRSGSHRRLFKSSPTSTRQLRRRAREASEVWELHMADIRQTDNTGASKSDNQVLEPATKLMDESAIPENAPDVSVDTHAIATTDPVPVEQEEPMDTTNAGCTDTSVKSRTEETAGTEETKQDGTCDASQQPNAEDVCLMSDDITQPAADKTSARGADSEECKVEVEQGVEVQFHDAASASEFCSCDYLSPHQSSYSDQTEEAVINAPAEHKDSEDVAENSEEVVSSQGFTPNEHKSDEKDLPKTTKLSADDVSDSIEPSAVLFSEPDQDLSLPGFVEEVDSAEEESPVSIPNLGFTDSFKESDNVTAPLLERVADVVPEINTTEEGVDNLSLPPVLESVCDFTEAESMKSNASMVTQADAVTDHEKIDKECAGIDLLIEHGTQTDFETTELQDSDNCKICGSCIEKISTGQAKGVEQAVKDASTQTEQRKTSDILDAAEGSKAEDSADGEGCNSFFMVPKDAALQVTPLKTKKWRGEGGSSIIPGSPQAFSDAAVASDLKMTRIQRLQQRFRTHSDRGMSMVQRSLLQRQLQKQSVGYAINEGQAVSHVREEGNTKPVETSRGLPSPSPTASPTSGILKKQHLQESGAGDHGVSQDESPTPNKKRRVSFADPVVSGESPSHEATLNKMPWRWDSPSKKSGYMPLREQVSQNAESTSTGQTSNGQISQTSQTSQNISQPSQNSYHSTQESQLDATEPIFPDLVDCDRPVEIVLPQLTSAAWHRGLSQLLAANGIITIGNLASQTELEIQSMPFRAPKVEVVRGALQQYYKQHYSGSAAKKFVTKSASAQGKVAENQEAGANSATHDEENEALPSAEEELHQLSPIKGESANNDIEEADAFEDNPSAEWPMEDLNDQVMISPGSSKDAPAATESLQAHPTEHPEVPPPEKKSLLDKLSSLAADESLNELLRMKKEDLSALHQQLSKLTNKVVGALINRCPSPPHSQ